MNRFCGIGRMVADPELKKTTSGKSVVSFKIAINRKFEKDKTDVITCVAWEQNAEFLSRYAHKGDWVEVTGRLQIREKETNGEKKLYTEIICEEVGTHKAARMEKTETIDGDDSIPF